MRFKLSLTYDGAPFCGYQRQPSAPSVQQCVEEALGRILGAEISITGAGRTDTGVNASAYVAHFDLEKEPAMPLPELCHKLNAILPQSISILSIENAGEDFHARFNASRREYTYFLHRKKDPFLASYSYLCGYPELDFDAMNKAAALLLGRRDFSCFEKVGADNKTSICTISKAVWESYTPTIHSHEDGYWKFTIAADRFLRNMVRSIVGTLIEVGRGKRSPESVLELLESHNRQKAGESVPGHALFLSKVDY